MAESKIASKQWRLVKDFFTPTNGTVSINNVSGCSEFLIQFIIGGAARNSLVCTRHDIENYVFPDYSLGANFRMYCSLCLTSNTTIAVSEATGWLTYGLKIYAR